MKPPLPKAFRIFVLVAVALLIPLNVVAILMDGSPWLAFVLMPGVFLAGYVLRDIDVR